MSEPRPIHRLFGLSWMDFCQDTPLEVEAELDLSLKQQFIDLVLIRKGLGPIPRRLPDGFEDLGGHNLITFKSHQESLDAWSLWELVGHFVNYRKQSSPSFQELIPEANYRLFAVCARFPQGLAKRFSLHPMQAGVYEVREMALRIRIIVVSQLPLAEQNAMLHLFSAQEDLLRYGQEHYRPHSQETSSLLYNLLQEYNEDLDMPEKMKDLVRKTIDEILKTLPAEERLKGLAAEERLKGLAVEERLKGLSAEEVVKALSPEAREALARQLKVSGSTS